MSPGEIDFSELDLHSTPPLSLPPPLAIPLLSYSLWLSAQLRANPSLQLRDVLLELSQASPPDHQLSVRQNGCGAEEGDEEPLIPPAAQLFDVSRCTRKDIPTDINSYRKVLPSCRKDKELLAGTETAAPKQKTCDYTKSAANEDVRDGEDAQCGATTSSCDGKNSCDSERSCESDDLSSDDESSSSGDSYSGFSSFGSEDSFEISDSSHTGSARLSVPEPLIVQPSSNRELAQQNDVESSRPALTLDDDRPFGATWPFGPHRFPPVSPASATESPGKSPNSKGQRVRWCDEEDGGSLVDVREFERSAMEWEDISLPPRQRRYYDAEEDDVCGCSLQ
ncbi:hypothetical protein CLOM_g2129 [Closterium sp. NIES-68]|nr:hypothetical protein CLOM_g2129 [Closterium sp. NIES-68]GJP70822.1 hypothetical protein CLOP_g1718 [Closterium sp. NIES-67]